MKPILSLLTVMLLFLSCYRVKHYYPVRALGYKPVYSNKIADLHISFSSPTPMVNAGKIYVKGNYIYQLDQYNGVHVYDKTIPGQTKELGFIRIRGATEISIRNDDLFTNAYADLIAINIADVQHPVVRSRVAGAFDAGYSYSSDNLPVNPPVHGVYYDCLDPSAGILTGWVKDSVNTNCYYP